MKRIFNTALLLLMFIFMFSTAAFADNIDYSFNEADINVRLSRTSLTLKPNETNKLKIIFDESFDSGELDVTYKSSNPSVAGVSDDGTVKAVKVGQANILCYVKEIVLTCKVTVVPHKVTKFSLSKASLPMTIKTKTRLSVTNVVPSQSASTMKVQWYSSNPNIAKVDSNGNISAVAVGTAKITAVIDGIKRYCTVTVKGIPLTSFTLNKGSCTMYKGGVFAFKVVKYYPSNATSLKTAIWKSSKPSVATIDKYGRVKALRGGKTIISCTVAGKTKSLELTVKEVLIKSFRINVSEKSINRGNSYTLSALSRYPSNTTDKAVYWRSSNTAVATVNSSGTVKANSIGYSTITCTIGNVKRQCKITVKGHPKDNRFVLYLSPSNQNDVIYNSSKRTNEKAECEAQARSLKAMLAPYNVDCFIATKQFNDRPQEAKALGADLFISIHTNAYNKSTYVYGPICFYNGLGVSKRMSDSMVKNINRIAPLGTNRYNPSQYNSFYYEMSKPRSCNIPSILLEIDFHDNPLVAPWLIKNKTQISTYMIKSLVEVWGIKKTR